MLSKVNIVLIFEENLFDSSTITASLDHRLLVRNNSDKLELLPDKMS